MEKRYHVYESNIHKPPRVTIIGRSQRYLLLRQCISTKVYLTKIQRHFIRVLICSVENKPKICYNNIVKQIDKEEDRMSIGSTIKKLRRERNMTQEQLAEYLSITANAVSQWECDRTAPDISQLPMLARILQVTTDRLLGVDFSQDEGEIERIADESFDCYRVGQREKAIEIVRNGLKQHPQSFRLMARLAESLIGIPGYEEELEGLCDRILKDCTESRPRDHAYRLKIILHGQRGEYGEVKKLAANLPHVWASQEELLLRWYHEDSEEHRMDLAECAKMYLRSLVICLGHIAHASCYSIEEKIQIRNQIIGILQIMFPDQDYCDEAVVLADEYSVIAALCAEMGNRDQALDAFERMCEYALDFETGTGKQYTSPVFRGLCFGGWISDEYSYCRDDLIPFIANPSFDPLRGEPRYVAVMEKLKNPKK